MNELLVAFFLQFWMFQTSLFWQIIRKFTLYGPNINKKMINIMKCKGHVSQ